MTEKSPAMRHAQPENAGSYFEIGKIIGARGIKGELRVYPTTDDPSRFALLGEVTLELPPPGRAAVHSPADAASHKSAPAPVRRVCAVESARVHQGIVLLKLAGVDDMTAAEKLRGASVWIPPEKALPLDKDEYYVRDLIGLEVVTDEGEALGRLTDVLHTGANDVYAVGKLLIPAIKDCVLDVDVPGRKMTVALMEGLRDL